MRSYHVGVAGLVAEADPKWIDNLLSHYRLPGVGRVRQGVARLITVEGLLHIVVIRELVSRGGLTTSAAVQLATRLLASSSRRVSFVEGLEVRLDLERLRRMVEHRIGEAAELSAPARRGRPPRGAR